MSKENDVRYGIEFISEDVQQPNYDNAVHASTNCPSNEGHRKRHNSVGVDAENLRLPKKLQTVPDRSTTESTQNVEEVDNEASEYEESTTTKEGIGTAPSANLAIPLRVRKSPEPHLSVLPIPSPGDTMAQIRSKLLDLVKVVDSGKSIALATGFAATPGLDIDAVKVAIGQMPPLELELWERFIDGSIRLPEINWTTDQEPAPTSPDSLKIAFRRAQALNRLYKTDKANERHVAWLTKHRVHYLPLVKAMARLIGAEINLTGGNGQCNATELADLQTINRVLSLSFNTTTVRTLGKEWFDITIAQQVLGRRRRELRALITKKGTN